MPLTQGRIGKPAARGSAALRKRLLSLSAAQLTDMLLDLVDIPQLQEAVPAPNVDELTTAVAKASRAVRKALPYSRYGSSTDEYGFKRARTANAALKKAVTDTLRRSDASTDPPSMLTVVDFLVYHLRDELVRFDNPKHNDWIRVAEKKAAATVVRAVKLLVKDANVGDERLEEMATKYADASPDVRGVVDAALAKPRSAKK